MTRTSGIAPGTRIGPYRIDAFLGAGGMGEVYGAEDTRLRRRVAIKILPASLADDRDRLARFEREARLLASLSHPRIGAIFGLEDADGRPALILELVEGPLLAERIAQGPLRVSEATTIAVQIAEAVEAAHERGIVHRDLKPANVKLTADGAVKVLDFGIAKVLADDAEPGDGTTVAVARTAIGMVVGTPSYMSPEQALGQPVDKRADIWAFGCLLFEMLAGRRPFDGSSQSAIVAGVLERGPDWTALPAATPAHVRWVLDRCLEKDPRDRLRDIGEARVALARPSVATTTPPTVTRRVRIPTAAVVAAALLAGLGAGLALGMSVGRRPGTPPTGDRVTLAVPPPEGHVFGVGFGPAGFTPNVELVTMAVSPDGSQLAFVATSQSKRQIWLRQLSAADPRPLEGTDGATAVFWSPDGRSIGFFADDRLKRIDLPNGRPVPICDVAPNTNHNGTWGRDAILFSGIREILRVPPGGGTPVVEVAVDRAADEVSVGWPWFLGDGRQFVYTVRYSTREGALKVREIGSSPATVMPLISNAQWVDPDLLVFVRDGTLLAQRFDRERRAAIGDPSPLADRIQYSRSTSRANFAVSRSGVVIYQSHHDRAELVWIDRAGKETNRLPDQADYPALRLTADGRTALVAQSDPRLGTYDLWSVDLQRGVRQRITFDPTSELLGAWLPGNTSIVFSAERGGAPHLFTRNLRDGVERELRPVESIQVANDVSPDGQHVLYFMRGHNGQSELWLAPLGRSGEPTRLASTPYTQADLRYAPVGPHVTLTSNESGRAEIYVASMPDLAGKLPVSSGGGTMARWSHDGTEIFYLSADRQLMSVRVLSRNPITLAPAQPLFALPQPWRAYEVSPTGQFLAIVPRQLGNAQPLTAVLNWTQAQPQLRAP